MTLQEYRRLQSELAALEKMITETPAESIIERMGLECRQDEIKSNLASVPAPNRDPARARLTFRGRPVFGTQGILVEFGASAVSAFADMVTAIGADLENVSLSTRGMIPSKEKYSMLITGTAVGSFGFELEEKPSDIPTLFPEESIIAEAIEQTDRLIQATLGSDDELTEAIADMEPRALDGFRKFLKTVADNEAVFALEMNGRKFGYADTAQLTRSLERIQVTNIKEDEITLQGVFEGVLPNRKTFEFRVNASKELISGKVSKEIEKPAELTHALDQLVSATFMKKTAGNGKPQYRLLAFVRVETGVSNV